MASFSTWRPLENRVSNTRFINQKNLKSQSERKSDPKALKLKYPSSTQTPNLKNPVKLSSPSSVDEVGACAAPGTRGLRLMPPLGLTPPLGRTAFGSRIWCERAAFFFFFSSSSSFFFFFFFFLAPGSDFFVGVVVLISLLVLWYFIFL